MEDPGVGVVHTYERHAQQHTMHVQPRQQPRSPDLIQLSDSDSNLPIAPPHNCGYTRITAQEFEAEDFHTNELNKNHTSHSPKVHSRKSSVNVPASLRDEDSEELEDFEPKSRQHQHSLRQTTSGSSDPGLSSPGSVSSPGSDSVTPTNLLPLQDGTELPAPHHRSSHWQRLVNDEHCHLLGTEEDSSDRHSSNEEDRDDEEQLLHNVQEVCEDEPVASPAVSSATLRPDSGSTVGPDSSCSSVAHGIALNNSAANAEGIWRISDEQRCYYTQQFQRLQPDLTKVVQGQQAKLFFEKSKLATDQLTRIWHLSDVTQDGALSLPEFLVAMHLVVARRNNVPLPTALPQPLLALLLPSLQPVTQHLHSGAQHQQHPKENAIGQRRGSSSSSRSSVVSSIPPPSTAAPSLPPSAGELSDKEVISPSRVKEWTKFVDSPTSNVSSPGLKPVNFDFQRSAVEEDPQILHPKAKRITPEPGRSEGDSAASSAGTSATATSATYLDPSHFGPTSLPMGAAKKEPPPPPPRPARTHARSSSLDLNKFLCAEHRSAALPLGAPPAVPPRCSPGHVTPGKKLVYQRSAGEACAVDATCSGMQHLQSSRLLPSLQHLDGMTVSVGAESAEPRLPCHQPLQSCVSDAQLIPRASAFEVYRKPSADAITIADQAGASVLRNTEAVEDAHTAASTIAPTAATIAAPAVTPVAAATVAPTAAHTSGCLLLRAASAGTKDKKDVYASIKTTRDRNTVLARLNNELNQELAEVIEERIALEMQLEQMKLFSN
ncbi:ralBP1-associated Eps domain-containing protein 1 isoform X2 [Hyalella azteca]|uniref:RalBP1-associated Eps domain-containing protein 1 isoform X2 n=1 Tax=Hyalella azteca TaxID=294128 RepID=A0A8B7N003_HYAAZ|nr:ralBP1-associated Eps domain-containing protein 1 isoform X2 [Hyalella azteca]